MKTLRTELKARKTQIWIRSSFALFGFAERWIDVTEFKGGLVRFKDPTVRPLLGVHTTVWVDVDAIEKIRSINVDRQKGSK